MKKTFTLLLFLLMSVTFIKPAHAQEAKISYVKLNNIYYNLNINGNIQSNGVTMFKLDDKIAYCIEPGVEINQKYYDIATDWNQINFTDEQKSYIELIGYYGYEYPNHNTDNYYIASQELIWQAVNNNIQVSWSTQKNNSGNQIDITKEKQEILSLVEKHKLTPSFIDKEIKDEVGKTITLTDENNVLENYELQESKYHNITKQGNTLTIKLNENQVEEEINLTRKYYDNNQLLIYTKANSQKLATLRITYDKKVSFKIKSETKPEEIEVPNTGFYDMTQILNSLLIGTGFVLRKII